MIDNKDMDTLCGMERNLISFLPFLNDKYLSHSSQEGFELVLKKDVKISTKKFLESRKNGIAVENENTVLIGSRV